MKIHLEPDEKALQIRLGIMLRARRKMWGLSVEEVASDSSLTPAMIHACEGGIMRFGVFQKCAKALGITSAMFYNSILTVFTEGLPPSKMLTRMEKEYDKRKTMVASKTGGAPKFTKERVGGHQW